MAGTLVYRLQVTHLYQRRFGEQAELAEALKSSHWYMITRRPAVRIIDGSVMLDDRILTVDVSTRADLASPLEVHTLGLDFGGFASVTNFRTYADGAYFSVELDGLLAHGDAWALASMMSKARVDLADQEILYIGEAFGSSGNSNAWNRVSAHKKLQQIYEDHAHADCDISVAPLHLERRAMISDDHIEDDEAGPSMTKYHEHFVTEGHVGVRKPSVDLIEHSLISHFTPHYNELLTEWRYDAPTKSMRLMRDAGFRLVQVHLSGWWGLARFHSQAAPNRFRSHLISHDLPPEPRRPVLRGIATENLSDWRQVSVMLQEGQELLEEAANRTGVTINIFGSKAPNIRRPPGAVLPFTQALSHDTSSTRDSIRTNIANRRAEAAKAAEPILHSGKSSYDPGTGTITAGTSMDGTERRRRLTDPSTGRVTSTIIFGGAESGRSNSVRVLMLEALLTGFFAPAAAEVSGEGELSRFFRDDDKGLYAQGLDGALGLLETICRMIDHRAESGAYRGLSTEVPAILLVIDDADAVLRENHGAHLVKKILRERNSAGISANLVLSDITAFESDPELMCALMSADYKHAFMPQGESLLSYLDAKYRFRREQTWVTDDYAQFVVHWENRHVTLGFAAAWLDAKVGLVWALEWATHQVEDACPRSPQPWQQVAEDNSSWTTFVDVQRWNLHQHQDVWLLTAIICSASPCTAGPAVIDWAERAIDARMEVVRGAWQCGPGTGVPGSEVLYSEALGPITPKDQSDSMKRFFAGMY
ncbi:hypothetical protein ACFWNN_10570 [Lentzea sp. NPDC058450]|uniref:hypothetical protein n=1 Tax=Lentzea sp. NPDC058450 TaxID=3346505 RepID=UPI003657560D